MLQSTYVYNDLGLGSSPDPNTRSFALSNDGNRLVTNSKNYIYVYDWNGTEYSSQASITSQSLVGTDATTYVSFDFNGDGTMFVVGFAGASNDDGDVFVYELNNGTWSLRYNNMRLSGDRSNARFGFSVSMSNDGNSLAIGTQGMKGSDGYVKLYHWDSSTSTYTEKQRYPGSEHTLGRTDTAYGYSVSLSKYGNTLVIGELKSYYTSVSNFKNGGLFIFRDITVGNDLFITNGRVGIGTDNPKKKLDIRGDSIITGKVGIGTDNPGSTLHIKALQDGNLMYNSYKSHPSFALTMERYGTPDTWSLAINSTTTLNHNDLSFLYNGKRKGFLLDDGNDVRLNFTGQHRNIVNNAEASSVGLIVTSTGKYMNLDNDMKPKINESLPICEISKIEKDKTVFGVISDKEDNDRVYTNGVWGSVFDKANVNEKRYFINSLGEGAMWVCNTNGDLENGDYITTSNVSGYGQKQDDDLLRNFTVAKITCDCNFSLIKENQKQIKTIQKEKIVDDILKDESGNKTIIQKTITKQELVFDNSGNVIIEDKQDTSGNTIEDYPYDIRFLLPDGTIISEEEYLTLKSNNKVCYIAYFVGVTYHCG